MEHLNPEPLATPSSDTAVAEAVVTHLLRHTRYLLTLKGRPPFRLAGIETYQRLQGVVVLSEELLAHRQEPRLARLSNGLQAALAPFATEHQTLQQGEIWLRDIDRPVMLDVGAHHGECCLVGAMLHDLTIHAFEPHPDSVAVLRQVIAATYIPNVHVYEVALSNVPGTGVLKTPLDERKWDLATLGVPSRFGEWTEQTVSITTLDLWGEENHIDHVDMIKIDVEGAEVHVLRGAHALIETFTPMLIVEVMKKNLNQMGSTTKDVTGRLREWGYKMREILGIVACLFCWLSSSSTL